MLTWIVFLTLMLSNPCKSSVIQKNSELGEEAGLREPEIAQDSENETSVQPHCKDDKFLQVLTHFRIANPEDLFLLSMREEFGNNLCRELTVGTDKVNQYLKHCSTTAPQDLYLKLIAGLVILKQKLCDDKEYRELFKRNIECYNVVRFETESCWGPHDWIEFKNTSEICNTMNSILGCYYTKTLLNCGLLPAETLNELMKEIMNGVSDDFCPNIVQENYVRDLRSLSDSRSSLPKPETLTVICCIILIVGRELLF